MQTFRIYVDYKYGCCETYTIQAKDLASARKKAKDRFAREYFNKHYLKTEQEPWGVYH